MECAKKSDFINNNNNNQKKEKKEKIERERMNNLFTIN